VIGAGTVKADIMQILPMIVICGTACIVLFGDIVFWKRQKQLNPIVSLLGIALALYLTITKMVGLGAESPSIFAGAVVLDPLTMAANIALMITGILSILMAWGYLQRRNIDHGEYYVLLLFSLAGAMLMASAGDLIVLFLGLEILSFALYVLAGFARTDERSEESSIKYFLLGAFASAFLLYGIALLYGALKTTNLSEIAEAARAIPAGGGGPMLWAGIGMIIVGLGFKAAVVPFHQWTPDVYEGAPTPVTAYMAGGAKIGAFAAMLRVFDALGFVGATWLPAIQIIAVLTMVFGNLLAVMQTNVKRMLAYSSIAHAGYLLVAIAAMGHRFKPLAHDLAASGAMFYLFAYVFMTLGAFGVLVYLSGRRKDFQTLEDLRGLARYDPPAAYAMLFFLLSLGGIPPTMGFMGKLQIFYAAVTAGEITLAIILAVTSVIAVYYYLKIVWMMAFDEPDEMQESQKSEKGYAGASIFLAAAATLLFGLLPSLLNPIVTILR
jgi:NADH-quinone oxidoreductase subunit N